MTQNNSIFTRVLALVLCMLMCAGVLTACFQMPEFNPVLNSNGVLTPDSTTGNVGENTPNEDPVDPEEPVDPSVIFSASTTVDANNLILGTLTNDVVIGGEGATALVPADVVLETGASSLALTLKNVEENDVDFGDAELLNNLDVHISGIAANNTVPMTVALGAILEAGLGATELKLYHIENGTPVLMTRVASASDFAIHNQYVYNEETGEVTIYVASFSVFTAVRTEADKWDGTSDISWYVDHENDTEYTLTTAEQFAGFRDLVDGKVEGINAVTFEGKTVKLGADLDLEYIVEGEKVSFDPIGKGYVHLGGQAFMGTFDGANHTIYGVYQNGWALGYDYGTQGGGLFASVQNATIKNLVVSNADIVMECIDMGIVVGYAQGTCYFENIIVTNSTIANYNRATGGVVGEVTKGVADENGYSHTFRNILVDSSVVVSSLWGSFDTLCGGVIGGKWGDASVLMDNVKVAAELDVYSDVTAAYQWYAYRRCGMLIGYTEQESPKKADHAHADFLTCNNVDVYYGEWVNYNYYEFEKQDSTTGQRYPWVRAEASPVGNNGAFSNPRYGVPTHTVDGVTTKVTELSLEALKEVATDYTPIVFNQLYGGGQGVYGTNEHAENRGVTIHNSLKKTIIVTSNCTNLKLYYWFANGNDTWTTLIEGIDMSGMLFEGNTYKIELPAYAYAFKIIADEATSEEFVLENLESNTVEFNKPCSHEYDNACDTTCNLCDAEREVTHTPGAAATCTTAQTCTVCGTELVKALGHTEVVDKAVAATCTTAGKTEGKHCSVCNTVLVAQTTVAALGHTWNISTHKCSCGEKAETKTIYFQNNWQWANVYVYYWYADDTQISGEVLSYPGAKLTTSTQDGSYQLYQITVPEYAEGFIISNGVDRQTIDLEYDDVTNSYLYYMVWDGKDGDGVDNVQSFEYKPGYTAVFFQNNWKWTKVSAYYWGSTKVSNPSWPGNSMTKVGKDGNKTYDVYVYYIPNDIVGLIIDGLKDGSTSTRDQTPDITSGWYNGICYYMDWVNNANKVQNKHISEIGCQ